MSYYNKRLLSAFRAVFVPLASLAIRHGITAAPVVEQLKIAFIEAARKEHGRVGKPASVNRTSQLTGLGRKHVSTLLQKSSDSIPRRDMMLAGEAKILSTWWTAPEYLNEAGLPIDLKMGPGPGTFEDLVKKATGSDAALSSLGRLKASGSVKILEDGRLHAVDRAYRVQQDLPRIICVSLATLAETISRNLGEHPSVRFSQRVAHTRSIQAPRVTALRRSSRERIDNFIETVDDLITSFESDDGEPIISPEGHELLEVGVGAYYFEIKDD